MRPRLRSSAGALSFGGENDEGEPKRAGSPSLAALRIAADRPTPASTQSLFRDGFAGAAKFGRKILQLWQAIPDREHGLGIVDVNAGRKGQRRNGGGKYVDEPERRMVGHQVSTAFGAILTLA